MAIRLVITDAIWAELEPVLRSMKYYAGSPPQLSDRLFIEAVLYQARPGIPWRDLPDALATGMPSIIAFAVGKLVQSGRTSGHTCNKTAVS
jgi:transposase